MPEERSKWKSSRAFRRFQRYSGMVQIAGGTASNFSTSAQFPTKVAQSLLSGYAFFKEPLKPMERVAHGVQIGLILSQLLLFSIAYFADDEECEQRQNNLCRWAFFLEFIYAGILFAGWCSAEFNREDIYRLLHIPEKANKFTQTPYMQHTQSKNKGTQCGDLYGKIENIEHGHETKVETDEITSPESDCHFFVW